MTNSAERLRHGLVTCFLIVGAAAFSFLIGYHHDTLASIYNGKIQRIHPLMKRSLDTTDTIPVNVKVKHAEAVASISQESIKGLLRYFTSFPHLAGTFEGYEQAQYVKMKLLEYGFDEAEIKEYFVMLSYPTQPGKVKIFEAGEEPVYQFEAVEEILHESENDSRVVYPFVAYSGSGDVEGEVVYANYGQEKDFEMLKTLGIDTNGKILIIRYGKVYRGDKVKFAQNTGAKGLLLYSDPENYNPDGVAYPYSWFLPDSGIQRGNVMMKKGDSVSPGYPSKNAYFHVDMQNSPVMPQIPVQPISARDAKEILRRMDGVMIPDLEWQGGFKFEYKVTSNKALRVNMNVSVIKDRRKIQNVIGTIYGDIEPDRLVLAGNHRDAWVFGGVDPSSGTAAMMEAARVIGEMKTSGWRPRRTIKFCSWDAEEYGIIGSTEWTEEYQEILDKRAVAYLNIDSAVEGNEVLKLKSSPLLTDPFFKITKELRDPNSRLNLFDGWRNLTPNAKNSEEPKTSLLGSGSDFAPFQSRIGVPCVDFRFTYLKGTTEMTSYPVYHSIHDNFHWMTTFVDPTMKYHRRVAEILVSLTLTLADSAIIPFSITRYANQLVEYIDTLESLNQKGLSENNVDIDLMKSATSQLARSADKFHERVSQLSIDDAAAVRAVNDQLSQFERNFIVQEGMPERKSIRHVIFSPSRLNNYAGTVFPGITDAIHNVQTGKGSWDDVKVQVTQVVYHIEMATASLAQLGLKNY